SAASRGDFAFTPDRAGFFGKTYSNINGLDDNSATQKTAEFCPLNRGIFSTSREIFQRNGDLPRQCAPPCTYFRIASVIPWKISPIPMAATSLTQKATWPNHQRQRSAFPNPRRPPSRDGGSWVGSAGADPPRGYDRFVWRSPARGDHSQTL